MAHDSSSPLNSPYFALVLSWYTNLPTPWLFRAAQTFSSSSGASVSCKNKRKENTVFNVFVPRARYQQSLPIIFIAASSFHYRCSHNSLVRTALQVPAAALVGAGTIKTEWSIVVLVELYNRKSLGYLKNSRCTSSYTLTLTGRHISGSMQSPPGHF